MKYIIQKNIQSNDATVLLILSHIKILYVLPVNCGIFFSYELYASSHIYFQLSLIFISSFGLFGAGNLFYEKRQSLLHTFDNMCLYIVQSIVFTHFFILCIFVIKDFFDFGICRCWVLVLLFLILWKATNATTIYTYRI